MFFSRLLAAVSSQSYMVQVQSVTIGRHHFTMLMHIAHTVASCVTRRRTQFAPMAARAVMPSAPYALRAKAQMKRGAVRQRKIRMYPPRTTVMNASTSAYASTARNCSSPPAT